MTVHGRVSEYLDGALGADVEAAFLAHLADCAECQEELDAEVQLRDREDAARDASGSPEHELHGRAGEYLDGNVDREAEAAFLHHIAACVLCQRGLHDEIQLRDREDALRDGAATARGDRVSAPSVAAETSLRSRLRRRRAVLIAGIIVVTAAAAAMVMLIMVPPGPVPTTSEPLALVLNPTRAVEIRLSYHAAARHRSYDTMRGDASTSEPIPPAVIAQLDAAGDCHGVATAYLLLGAWGLADEQYRRCPVGVADIDADRAGLEVLRSKFDSALELTQPVLDTAPDHPVALWNRALALHRLGLGLSAAAAFERVATLEQSRDPEWAHEASERAANARAEFDRMRTDHEEVERLGKEMARGGRPLERALAIRVPARSRLWLHNALRTATSAARLDELAPLAAAIEGLQGEGLGRYVAQARTRLSPDQAIAAAGYRAIVVERRAVDHREWANWLAVATRAKVDDVILGARIVARRLDGTPSAEQLAAATHDPWFERAVELLRARAALEAGRIEEATARLTALQVYCPPGATSYRCLDLAVALARLTRDRHLPSEAKRHALTALALSRTLAEWPQRAQALTLAGDAERFGGDFGSARAYYEEAIRSREPCDARELTFTVAEMLYQDHRLAQARALAAAAPRCDKTPSAVEVAALARLLRTGHMVADRATVLAEIARARAAPTLARDWVFFDFLVEWLAIDDDIAVRERLAPIRDAAQRLEGSDRKKVTLWVDGALFADAARRGSWTDALAIVARARGVPPPSRCALAIGADDFRFAVVALGPDGAVSGRYERDLPRPEEWLAPEPMRRALAGCEDVVVLALPPWLGIGPILDASTPWHYVLGPSRSPVAGPPRHVVIADPVPPPSAELAPLTPRAWPPPSGADETVTGLAATPERVLAVISDATLVEIHGHAIWLDRLEAPVLALSPGTDGWTLDAARISTAALKRAPIVVLADCSGGVAARFEHDAWGLPGAFRTAGARAVIASLAAIPDRDAAAFFDALIAQLSRDVSPASALARIRAEKMRGDPTSWMRHVVVFQ